ncbi:type IV secretion system protein [Burkholderia cenocepacia]|uniref:type IV secretion system protein n=1 Tax=Burkholderia cenocepacia TaxID=95486 RepID=UPI00209D883B|nr:type IV secretion system protein [Burkholderia cenocepacia]MCO8327561.1 type IV secretion system protein [Burkholderia cenocepacia]MCO8334810.1 type IV secretion system protein [Burkholderia cenocepacia]MCO8342092.1 type IV secretion system protein [Burkholderia cenocepacia]MCO8349417.1 type IV secretion system protein [Burkholderia cenocepacia]MCO8362701.1 type IV secretion system protein [Burkholderia cenocepacia]
MSGLFSAVGGTLENGMHTYVSDASSALSSALVPVATTGVLIWVLAYGMAVIRGEAHEPVPAFAWRGMKVVITLAFALSAGLYQSQVVTAVSETTTGVAQAIQAAAVRTGAGNVGCGSVEQASEASEHAVGIYRTLDCYDRQLNLVVDAYFDKATHEGLSMSGIVAGIGDLACGLVAAFGGAIFLMVLGVEVMMARMLLDLVLALGPMFIACGAFSPTVRFFEAWTAKLVNYALLQVLVAAFLGLALAAFSANLAPFQVTIADPDTSADALAAAARQALQASAPWAAAFGMFVTSVLLATIGWQLPAVASGLAGGATVSGFGAFVAGYASRRAAGAMAFALRSANRSAYSGGRISRPGALVSPVSPHPPAYQRAAREQLDRALD